MIRGVRMAVGAQILGVLMIVVALALAVDPLAALLFAGVMTLVGGWAAEADMVRRRQGS